MTRLSRDQLSNVGAVRCSRCGHTLARIRVSSRLQMGRREVADVTVSFEPEPTLIEPRSPVCDERPGAAVTYYSLSGWRCRRCKSIQALDYDEASNRVRGRILQQILRGTRVLQRVQITTRDIG